MNKYKLIYGVGKNDSDTPVCRHINLGGGKFKRTWMCPIYITWRNMLMRCYSPECQEQHPTYIGCSVIDDWLSFSSFRGWMEDQFWQNKDIDKDVLFPGNKIYGPEYCVFIDSRLNSFLTDRGRGRGDYPIGASWEEESRKFKASCSNPFSGRLENLGRYSSPEAAHEAWRRRKHEHAERYADMQDDPRVAEAIRCRYLPGSIIVLGYSK